jgi:hypothetical protein
LFACSHRVGRAPHMCRLVWFILATR